VGTEHVMKESGILMHPMHENPLWWVNRYAEISDYEKLIK
jgi:hypothetical protein